MLASVRSSCGPSAAALSTTRDARRMISRISATSASIRSIGASISTASCTGASSLMPCRVAMMQATRKMSAPVACTGQLRIERSLSSVTPVRHVQPIAVRIDPGLQGVLHPVVGPRQYCANTSRCWLSISCASNVETPALAARVSASMPYCVASSTTLYLLANLGVRRLGGAARRCADALGEGQIWVAAVVGVEHGVVRAAVPVGQHRRDHEFHGAVIDVRDGHAGLGLDQRAQPHRWREDPLRRLRLRARRLGLEWPQHRAIATVGTDRELDLAHLVARVAQLAQTLELRPALAHVLEGLAPAC